MVPAPVVPQAHHNTTGRSSDLSYDDAVFPATLLVREATSDSFASSKKGLTASGNVADFHCIPILAPLFTATADRRTNCTTKLRIFADTTTHFVKKTRALAYSMRNSMKQNKRGGLRFGSSSWYLVISGQGGVTTPRPRCCSRQSCNSGPLLPSLFRPLPRSHQ